MARTRGGRCAVCLHDSLLLAVIEGRALRDRERLLGVCERPGPALNLAQVTGAPGAGHGHSGLAAGHSVRCVPGGPRHSAPIASVCASQYRLGQSCCISHMAMEEHARWPQHPSGGNTLPPSNHNGCTGRGAGRRPADTGIDAGTGVRGVLSWV